MRIMFFPFLNTILLATNLFPEKLKFIDGLPFTENVMLFFPTTFNIMASTFINLDTTSDGLLFGFVNLTTGRGNVGGLYITIVSSKLEPWLLAPTIFI